MTWIKANYEFHPERRLRRFALGMAESHTLHKEFQRPADEFEEGRFVIELYVQSILSQKFNKDPAAYSLVSIHWNQPLAVYEVMVACPTFDSVTDGEEINLEPLCDWPGVDSHPSLGENEVSG